MREIGKVLILLAFGSLCFFAGTKSQEKYIDAAIRFRDKECDRIQMLAWYAGESKGIYECDLLESKP